MNKRVLIVDSNQGLVADLFAFLEPRAYRLDLAQNGVSGLELALQGGYDAMILGWDLPRMDGLGFIQRLRNRGARLPVIMLTARDDLADKISAFRSGVDDYLTMPFDLAELEVRLEALMLRGKGRQSVLVVDDLTFEPGTQLVKRSGAELKLYPAGKRLLEVLMRASPEIVGRQQLESLLWGDDPPDADLLRSHMYELRRSVDWRFDHKLIQTVPRQGYRIIGRSR